MRVFILVLSAVLLHTFAMAASPKRALKLLEKAKYDKVENQLKKLLDKDSISPGAHYVYSLMYLDTGYHQYQVDSAWWHIKLARTQYEIVDEKALKKLSKANINDSTILRQKLRIDTAAFAEAKQEHTIAEYDKFIDNHPTAPQLSQAIELRNEIAWQEARRLNTYEAYQYFMKTYPGSRQIKEAVEFYDILLFQEKTKDGKLSSYQRFLQQYPETPYRHEAENKILKLSTISNHVSTYVEFIKNYPRSRYAPLARSFLYHLHKQNNSPNSFFSSYRIAKSDSLQQAIALDDGYWITTIDENSSQYGFRNKNFNLVLDFEYEAVPKEYYCGNIFSDVLEVKKGGQWSLMGRNGSIIWSKPYQSFTDMGYGLLKILNQDNYIIIHKSGYQLTDLKVQDATVIAEKFIKIVDGNKVGLVSFFGLPLISSKYDDINYEDGLFVFKNNDMLALATAEMITKGASGQEFVPRFLYDEVELMNNGMVRCYRLDAETLLDQALHTVIPFEKHQIHRINNGWLVKKDGKNKLLNERMLPISESGFDQVQHNDYWLAIKKDNRWAFFSPQSEVMAGFIYDSAKIMSNNFAYLSNSDSTFIFTTNRKSIPLKASDEIQLLKDNNMISSDRVQNEYIAIIDNKNYITVFSASGKQLMSGKYNKVTALGNDYLLVEYRNKSLYDTEGNQLLKSIFDGIGHYNNGYVSILRNKKFGLYNKTKAVHIKPQFDALLKPYGDSLILASKNNDWGLIDLKGEKVLDYKYEKIVHWNDTSTLVMNDENQWQIISIADQKVLVDKIDDFRFIDNKDEEKIILCNSDAQYGIYSSTKGEVIPPTFNEIVNLGSNEYPLYFAEKNIREADFYVIIYYNSDGKILQRQAFTEEQYEKIYCE